MVYPSRFQAKVMRAIAVFHGLGSILALFAWVLVACWFAWLWYHQGSLDFARMPPPWQVGIGAFLIIPPVLVAMGGWLLLGYHRIAKGVAGVNPVRLWTLSLLFNLLSPVSSAVLALWIDWLDQPIPWSAWVPNAVLELLVISVHVSALVRELAGKRALKAPTPGEALDSDAACPQSTPREHELRRRTPLAPNAA